MCFSFSEISFPANETYEFNIVTCDKLRITYQSGFSGNSDIAASCYAASIPPTFDPVSRVT
jgi:hypothetical protein